MTTQVRRTVPFSGDPIATAAALAAGARDQHVVYEQPGEVWFAEGAQASVVVSGGTAALRLGHGRRQDFAAGPALFDGVRSALGALPATDWRVFGWVSFEHVHRPTEDTTAHLIVPRRQIRFAGDTAVLTAVDDAEMNRLHDRLERAITDAAAPPSGDRVTVSPDGDEAELYRKAVAEAIDTIRSGALDKVILSRIVPVPGEIDLPATYLAGRRGNDPARSFLLDLGGWAAAGFSPEIVARVTAHGTVVTQPLAGTRALAGDPRLDLARRGELYRDTKEVFEHAISVHLAATEMATVCAPGTVHVQDFMSVKERGSVQHLASEVSGRLADGATAWDTLSVLFPAITASGVPKRAACDLIRQTEPNRGLYSGAVLTAAADGTLDAALVLRSVFRHAGRTWLRAGAGVVAKSDPARELEETREKLLSVSRFLVPAR
ncbi:salicylate synthase [Catenuloplanes indicus]|uniref:Salicylate synthase n=1 Tax=Catenuloplanes indicus TaxID=137267 RepID=A0AAE3VV20_9ACTN|nr:salicylate synthase [Catenuloplanes indicus]MDQ0363550.1 salicylate synthase [Catenuloplanes indicus]